MPDDGTPRGEQLTLRRAGDAGSALSASWRPSSLNEKARTVEVSWTTGADVLRQDAWTGRRYVERLIVDPSSVNLERLASGASPVLDSHDRSSVARQVGVVERAEVSDGVGHARIRFASDPESDAIFRKVVEGVARSLSVGYTVDATRVTERDGEPDLHEITRWTPFECRMVALGADPHAQVRSHTNSTAAESRRRTDPWKRI